MADKDHKFENNVPGKYYISWECIGCGLCAEIAADNFMADPDEYLDTDHSYVYKQPENAREDELCREAMETCPANAIKGLRVKDKDKG